jgi:hypothetical protein
VLAGEYRLTAERIGFKKTEVRSVKVDVSIPATVNLVFEAGQISETVQTTASESQSVINTENAELSTSRHRKADQRSAAERTKSHPARSPASGSFHEHQRQELQRKRNAR